MANYATQKTQTYATVIGQGGSRNLVTDGVSVAMTTAMLDNANDEVELLWVPKGAVIVGATLSGTDMDTNGSPALLFDVGDADDEDRLISASTVGQAGVTLTSALAAAGHMYKYSTATKIKAFINTASATPAAGTLKFSITYFVDENFSATNAVVA